MKSNLQLDASSISKEEAIKSINEVLGKNKLCAIASIRENNKSYIHTAFYVFTDGLELFFLSEPCSQHSLNFENNSSTAISIYDSNQVWGKELLGIQLFGKCEGAKGKDVIKGYYLYAKRYNDFVSWIKHPDELISGIAETKLYKFTTEALKIFDEKRFGKDEYVTGTII